MHESFFEELAEKSNHGVPENDYSFAVHLAKQIIWENGSKGPEETKYGYATDQIIESVSEEEYSKKLSGDVVDSSETELGIVNVSKTETKLSNLIDAARKFYTFNKEAKEVIIVTSEDRKEEVKEQSGEDCEITIKDSEEAISYAHDTNSPINI